MTTSPNSWRKGNVRAEAAALAGFGTPRAYARRLSDGFYETSHSLQALLCSRVLLTSLFALLAAWGLMGDVTFDASLPSWLLNPPASSIGIIIAIFYGVFGLTPLGIVLAAFLARRTHTRLIAVCGTACTLASLFVTGLYTTTLPYDHQLVDRRQLRGNIAWFSRQRQYVANDLLLLDEGRTFYSKAPQQDHVPADLLSPTGYIVPLTWNRQEFKISRPLTLPNAFQIPVPMSEAMRAKLRVRNGDHAYTLIPSTVTSLDAARRQWLQNVSLWRAAKSRELTRVTRQIGEFQAISPRPDLFDSDVFWWRDLDPLFVTLFVGCLDFAGAWAGRRMFLARRNKFTRSDRMRLGRSS